MRQYDLSPLYRSTVGFDRLFAMLDQASGTEAAGGYPPYNIERTGELDYRISVAVAGFAEADLSIESRENTLTIRGAKEPQVAAEPTAKREVLHQGIAARAFERRFQLAEHVQVVGASLENGLLHVDLVREIPEAQKPRQIPIGRVSSRSQGRRDPEGRLRIGLIGDERGALRQGRSFRIGGRAAEIPASSTFRGA